MARLQLTFFGGFKAQLGPGRHGALTSKKAKALLAYLALTPGRSHPRPRLAALLWGDIDETRARNSLRQELAVLRAALGATGAHAIADTPAGITLDAAAVEVDVTRFARLVSDGSPKALAQAVDLYAGDLLAGLDTASAAFEEWLRTERERLRDSALAAFDVLLGRQLASGPRAALETAHRVLALDPTHESAHRALMQVHADEGRLGDAIRQYQACVAVLRRELGVEPAAATRELYQATLDRQRGGETSRGRRVAPIATRHIADVDTPLVGRSSELERLDAALETMAGGRGQVVQLIGEAGIGKSRLVAELAHRASARGARILVGRCHDNEQVLPLRPWTEMLDVLVGAPELRSLKSPSRALLAALLPALSDAGPRLATATDDPIRRFEAVLDLLRHLATSRPLVLVIEDLHWADDTSLRLLSFVSRRLGDARILMVLTVRAEELADVPLLERLLSSLARDDALVRITLGALSRDTTLRLVEALASRVTSAAGLGERVWTFSRGHPFLTVEALRAVEEGGRLATRTGDATPERVRDLMTSRLSRLGERGRQLATVAAVIGRPFDVHLLERVSGLTAVETRVAVDELSRRRVLGAADDLLDFTHDRIREEVYAQTLPAVRKALHASTAREIETLHAGALDAHAGALAVHHRESESWDAAARYFQQAGRYAAARASHREAVQCFDHAVAALAQLSMTPERLAADVDLRFDLRNSLVPLGAVATVRERLREAESIAARLGDRRRLGWIASYSAFEANLAGRYATAVDAGERALSAAHDGDDATKLRVHANYCLAIAYYSLGDFGRAVDAGRRAIDRLGDAAGERAGGATLPGVVCRTYMAFGLAELGLFAEAGSAVEEAAGIAARVDHRYSAAVAAYGMGAVRALQGEIGSAVTDFERALAICRAGEFDVLQPFIASGLGMATVRAGRIDEGLRVLEGAQAQAAACDFHLWAEQREQWLAEGHLASGRHRDAEEHARRALALARERGAHGVEAWTLRVLGLIGSTRELLADALKLATALGMRPLQAHSYLDLGRLHLALGERDEAREALAAAAKLFGALGTAPDVTGVEALLAGLARR